MHLLISISMTKSPNNSLLGPEENLSYPLQHHYTFSSTTTAAPELAFHARTLARSLALSPLFTHSQSSPGTGEPTFSLRQLFAVSSLLLFPTLSLLLPLSLSLSLFLFLFSFSPSLLLSPLLIIIINITVVVVLFFFFFSVIISPSRKIPSGAPLSSFLY